MNTIKKAYYYFFYIFYKSAKAVSSWLPYDFVATVVMGALEFWILFTVINSYNIFNDISPELNPNKITFITGGIIIFIVNYISFIHYDSIWKKYFEEFNKLSKTKNKIGGIIIWIISIGIFVICLTSIYQLQKKFYNTPEVIAKERNEDSLQKAKQIENLKKIYGEDK